MTDNQKKVDDLIANGYVDRGWVNGGQDFSIPKTKVDETIDCSSRPNRGNDTVYVSHTLKELLHVDSSD